MINEESKRIGRNIFNDIRDEREIDLETITNNAQKNGIEFSQDLVQGIRTYNEIILPKIKELKKEAYGICNKAEYELGIAEETYMSKAIREGLGHPL